MSIFLRADLAVFEEGKNIFYLKVVVGKRSTPSHTISSRLNDVVLYPNWQVPNSIAIKELLPHIKKDIGFIEEPEILEIKSTQKIGEIEKNFEERFGLNAQDLFNSMANGFKPVKLIS